MFSPNLWITRRSTGEDSTTEWLFHIRSTDQSTPNAE
jgi:hypothetical protein